jgi:hypothetical protein
MKLVQALNSVKMRIFDYSLGVGAIGYGVYSNEWWAAGLGVVGLGLTHFKVAQRVSDKIIQNFAPKEKVDHSKEILAARAEHEAIAQSLQHQEIHTDPRILARQEALQTPGILKYQMDVPYYQGIQANPYKNNILHHTTSNLYSKGVPFC